MLALARAPLLAHRHSPKTWNRSTAIARRATTRGRRVVPSARAAEPTGEVTPAFSAPSESREDPLASFRDGDLLLLRVAGPDEDEDAESELSSRPLLDREWFFEVVGDARERSSGSHKNRSDEVANRLDKTSLVGLCRGVPARLKRADDGETYALVPVGERDDDASNVTPRLADRRWVESSFPAWRALLADLESTGEYPKDPNVVLRAFTNEKAGTNAKTVVGVEKVTDYASLREAARSEATNAFWRDGAPAGFVETDPKRHATNNAGELLCLLEGQRGVVMTQLWAGWEDEETQQPVDAPFALRALRECARDARVAVVPAAVPGMPARKGLTAILCADASPFPERAKHLASFGAQAALVAGSPYYQYLVGRVLGYAEANVDAHVRSRGGRLTAPVVREAEKDLAALSDAPARLPWRRSSGAADENADENASGEFFFLDAGTGGAGESARARSGRRGKKKKTSTVRSVEDAESMFGGRGKKKK